MKITAKGTAEEATAGSRAQHGCSVRQGVDIRLSNYAEKGRETLSLLHESSKVGRQWSPSAFEARSRQRYADVLNRTALYG